MKTAEGKALDLVDMFRSLALIVAAIATAPAMAADQVPSCDLFRKRFAEAPEVLSLQLPNSRFYREPSSRIEKHVVWKTKPTRADNGKLWYTTSLYCYGPKFDYVTSEIDPPERLARPTFELIFASIYAFTGWETDEVLRFANEVLTKPINRHGRDKERGAMAGSVHRYRSGKFQDFLGRATSIIEKLKDCRLARMSVGHYCLLRSLGPAKGGNGMKHHAVVIGYRAIGSVDDLDHEQLLHVADPDQSLFLCIVSRSLEGLSPFAHLLLRSSVSTGYRLLDSSLALSSSSARQVEPSGVGFTSRPWVLRKHAWNSLVVLFGQLFSLSVTSGGAIRATLDHCFVRFFSAASAIQG